MVNRRRFSTFVSSTMRRQTAFGSLFILLLVAAIWKFGKQPRHISVRSSSGGPLRRAKNGVVYKFFQAGSQALHVDNLTCPVAWEWTEDRKSADVVWYDILQRPFPSTAEQVADARSFPDQLLVFYSSESGTNHDIVFKAKSLGYDISVDYRIWPGNPNGEADIPAVYLLNPTSPEFPTNFRRPMTWPKRTDAYMAAFISNCGARNRRSEVLKGLMELMPVHSFGNCLKNENIDNWMNSKYKTINYSITISGPERYQQKLEVAGNYYFIFAPENSNEWGYVTEKIYEALETTAVPIYMGAQDVDRFMPSPKSFINVEDFDSTADLAAHLLSLVDDDQKYLKYFEWKHQDFSSDFQRVLRLAARTPHCRLAMKLAGQDYERDMLYLTIFPPSSTAANGCSKSSYWNFWGRQT
jgi:hypothetical protein